jgi:DNA recombination protein RmuC
VRCKPYACPLCLPSSADPKPTFPQKGEPFDTPIIAAQLGLKAASLLSLVVVAVVVTLRIGRQAARRRAENLRLETELGEARAREEAAVLARAQLDAALRATQEAADAQRSALTQLSAELGDRLLEQQAASFQVTTAALERRASAESESIRAAYEAATAERNERLRAELQPMRETLQQLSLTSAANDSKANTEFTRLLTLVQGLGEEERAHRDDTRKLLNTLRVSQVRGRYGEWTLQRTLEAAGLQEHVHYLRQPTARDEDGAFRPDVVVLLPQDRCVIVDSKATMQHLLDAHHAANEAEMNAALDRHARALRTHVEQLSGKNYAARIAASMPGRTVLDGAVLFVPAEGVLEAALRRDPQLLQYAASRRVHLVTPTTLLVVLSAVEQLWRQDGRDRRADEVEQLGTDVIERIAVVLGHVARLQRQVGDVVSTFNALTASLESRLLPVARRLEGLGVRTRESLPTVSEIDTPPRELGPRLTALIDTAASPTDNRAPGDSQRAA